MLLSIQTESAKSLLICSITQLSTPSKGKVSVGLTGNKDIVQIKINDTGPGIRPEDLPHLFQKFYRVDNSATRSIGGTGLGLFICRKIVELYHGTIWAESKVGEGSTFYINSPRLTLIEPTNSDTIIDCTKLNIIMIQSLGINISGLFCMKKSIGQNQNINKNGVGVQRG